MALLNERVKGLGDYVQESFLDPTRAISPRKALRYTKFLYTMEKDMAGQVAFGNRWFDIDSAMKLAAARPDDE